MGKKIGDTESQLGAAAAPATQADLDYVAGLSPSSRKARGWIVSGTLVDSFSNPKMQAALRTATKELGVLGFDVEGFISTANQAATAVGATTRLDESAGRAHQQAVELNKDLLTGQTALLTVKEGAASGTTIAKALKGVAGIRQQQVAQTKRVKTERRKKKKKP